MTTTVFMNGKRMRLEDRDLLGVGGEGRVFRAGDHALKVFFTMTDARRKKLAAFPTGLPDAVVGPVALCTDQRGTVVGYAMRALEGAVDIHRLGQRCRDPDLERLPRGTLRRQPDTPGCKHWWLEMGQAVYPKTRRLLITADCGGSNGYRVRLWRRELQKLADEQQLSIQVCHFPPGTSKWNKIEHRMFCHITANWRGRPLISREVVVNLIGGTTTTQGLHIKAVLDENRYAPGIKVSDEELATLVIERDEFHGEWNYQLRPRDLQV